MVSRHMTAGLYDERVPLMHLEALDTFRYLKEQLDTDYYEQLIQTYLLDNPHASLVLIRPERGLTARMDAAQKEKLAAYKDSLSEEEKEKLAADTPENLRAYQEAPDGIRRHWPPFRCCGFSDIRKEAEVPPTGKDRAWPTAEVLFTEQESNGIGYVELDFDARAGLHGGTGALCGHPHPCAGLCEHRTLQLSGAVP